MRHGWRRWLLAVAAVALALGLSMALTHPGRAAVKAVLFVPQIMPTIPVKPQEWFLGEPQRQEIRFPVGPQEGVADLYLPPKDGRYPAVVLFFGVIPAGRDDPRILNLANALARSNMVVLIPWSEVMVSSYRLDPAAVDLLVAAFQYLESHPWVNRDRIGVGGFCVGASFAMLAAEDERIRDRVAYVNSFGGYYDARDLLVAIASRTRLYEGVVEPWQPRDDTRKVFTLHLIEGLPDAREQEAFRRVFVDGRPPGELERAALSDQGKIVYRLLSGTTREEAERLMGSLAPEFLADLDLVSPKRLISELKAPLLVMHDREDTAIPAAESRRLAEALEKRGSLHYTEFSLFQHVDPTRPVSPPVFAKEVWKLLRHMYQVMRWGT